MRGGVDTSQFAHNIADEDFGIAEEHERFVFIITEDWRCRIHVVHFDEVIVGDFGFGEEDIHVTGHAAGDGMDAETHFRCGTHDFFGVPALNTRSMRSVMRKPPTMLLKDAATAMAPSAVESAVRCQPQTDAFSGGLLVWLDTA